MGMTGMTGALRMSRGKDALFESSAVEEGIVILILRRRIGGGRADVGNVGIALLTRREETWSTTTTTALQHQSTGWYQTSCITTIMTE